MSNWVAHKGVDERVVHDLLWQSAATNQFTNYGPVVQRLERFVQTRFQLDKPVVCVSNATVGLHVLTTAIGDGRQWATQSFTFPSSAQGPLRGAHIVDIDPGGGLDLKQVPAGTAGLIVTNVFGNVVDIDRYVDWCAVRDTKLVFDCAATPMTLYKGKNSANYGTGAVISFHHTKSLGFGEGGCIVVDQEYEALVRRLINFGFGPEWSAAATNGKMSDISAAYILQYLSGALDAVVAHHKLLYTTCQQHLPAGISLYPTSGTPFVNCLCLLVSDQDSTAQERILRTNGVYYRKYYPPLKPTPYADAVYRRVLCLPCTVDISTQDIGRIMSLLR